MRAGERHGTPAERLLAAQQRVKMAQMNRPHTLFAAGPRDQEVMLAAQQATSVNSYAAAGYQDPTTAMTATQWPGAHQGYYAPGADASMAMWNANGSYAMQGGGGWQQGMQAAPPPNMPPPPMAPRPMQSMTQNHP